MLKRPCDVDLSKCRPAPGDISDDEYLRLTVYAQEKWPVNEVFDCLSLFRPRFKEFPFEEKMYWAILECYCKTFQSIKKSPAGYVYVLKGEYDLYKIGKANHVNARINQFSPLLPFDTKVVCAIPTEKPIYLESHLHGVFGDRRKRGEWFVLSDNDVNYLLVLADMYSASYASERPV